MSIRSNLNIDQGTDFLTEIDVVDEDGLVVDLTGYTANAYMKREWDSASKITITTAITAESGLITLSMNHAQTANLEPRNYVWCVDVNTSNNISRLCRGIVTVNPSPDWTTYVAPTE